MEPGDIFNLRVPRAVDTEKPRPVLVVAIGPTGPNEDKVVVIAPMSSASRLFEKPYRGDLILDDWREFSLSEPSVLRCRHIQGVPHHWLSETPRGRVDAETLRKAQEIARRLLA